MNAVMVTGASGFIGRAACSAFEEKGWNVVRATRESGSLERGWPLQGIDVVVHLAGIAHQLSGQDAESTYMQLNARATERLALEAKRAGVRRFVFMSSIKVHGERTPADRPFRAADTPHPQDRYARSKWQAEQALARVAAETGLEVVVLRAPLVYGPGVKANFLRLVRLVERRLPLPLGAVDNRRSLLYVGNLADLIVLAASSPQAAGRTLLAADGEDLSTPQLVREIGRALGVSPTLLPIPVGILRLGGTLFGRKAELDRLVESLAVDASETRRFGWQPPYTVATGIEETVRWWRTR